MQKKPNADISTRDFWKNNERFADLFNAVLFHGKEVINPRLLTARDSDVSASIPLNKHYQHVKKYQDVTKIYKGMELSILGIENQLKIHYAMPLRNRLYDDLDYLEECSALTGIHKKMRDFSDADEFLSGIKKEDRLHMSLRIVVYYGETPWDGPICLSDMIQIPQEFREFFQDYRMTLVSIVDPANQRIPYQNRSVQILMSQLPLIYQENWAELRRQNVIMDRDTSMVIASITNSEHLKQIVKESKGEISMCTALENLERRIHTEGHMEGRTEGLAEGRMEGRTEGRMEGRTEGMELAFHVLQYIQKNKAASDAETAEKCQCSLEDVQHIRKLFSV